MPLLDVSVVVVVVESGRYESGDCLGVNVVVKVVKVVGIVVVVVVVKCLCFDNIVTDDVVVERCQCR